MNGPFIVAQANTTGTTTSDDKTQKPVKIIKVTKPADGQAITVELGYDQQTKVDLTAIASENITLVHIGERLIILFDNRSTVTIEPYFDSMNVASPNVTFEVAPGRIVGATEFASLFPITTDQSVLPAAGTPGAPPAPASGASFSDPSVDPLFSPEPLPLLPPEFLPNWEVNFPEAPLLEGELPEPEPAPPPNGFPSIGSNVAVQLDDDALAGGIAGGVGDVDPDTAFTSGVLTFSFGPDGGGSIVFLTTGAPAGFSYEAGPNNSLLVKQGGTLVVTLTLDPATGAYTVTQNAPVAHAGSGEAGQLFTINYRVTDSNGNFIDGVLPVDVNDDSPVRLLDGNLSTGSVDEDGVFEGSKDNGLGDGIANGPGDLAVPNTDGDNDESTTSGNVSALFLSGADVPLTYSLVDTPDAQAALNGLGLTSGGVALTYAVTGNVLTASTDNTFADPDAVVFTFTLNPTTGAWTFDLEDQLDHPSLDGLPGDNEENDLPIALGAIVQATDSDGDVVTANAGSLVVTVNDDTPIQGAISSGTVDEDGVVEGVVDAGPGDGIPGGTGDFVDPDTDLDSDETTVTGTIAGLPQFQSGADEPLSFSLVTDTSALEAQNLTSGGVALTYSLVGNVLTAEAGVGNTVFTFTLNPGGAWVFDLEDQLDHAPGNNENDLTIFLGSLIQATDFDGDTAPGGAVQIVINDDTPIATAGTSTGTVDEDGVVEGIADAGRGDGIAGGPAGDVAGEAVVATGSVTGLFQSGADEPLTYSLSGNFAALIAQGLKSGGVDLSYSLVSGVSVDTVTATAGVGGEEVFTFALDKTTGAWTFTLIDQLDHAPGNDENDLLINLGAIVQATDFDGDSVIGNANGLVITVNDDVPDQTTATVNINVDEDELATALSTGITDNDATTTVATFSGADIAGLVASGADEPVKVSLNPAIDNVDTGLDSKGENILFDVVSPTQVNGVAGARVVFTLVQDAGADTVLGTVDDTFTFTLLDQVDHTPLDSGAGDDETIVLSLASVFVATDFDGDSIVIDAGATVTIENDVPDQTTATVNINVDEDELATALSTGITDNDATTTVATFSGADIAGLVASGADEPVKVSLNPAIDNVDTGLDSKGENILFDVVSPTQVNGVAGARVVFTLVQDAGADTVLGTVDDTFTFTLLDQVDHTPLDSGAGDDETIVLSLASVFVATDFDGDSIVIDAGATVTIENDVPDQTTATVNINVDEDELATALSTGITDNDATTTVATFSGADIAGLVASGADEPVKVSLNPAIDNVDTGLDSKGENILFDVVSPTQVNGVAGARVVFTLVQDAGADTVLGTVDDTFTFTLLDQVDHTPLDSGAGDDETIVLSLASVFVATDFDGDSIVIDAGATVTIENDVPDQTTATVNINVDEDELATALSTGITDNDATTTVATFSGADIAGLVASGADEPVKVSLNPAIDNVDTGLDSKGENILFDVVSPTQVNGVAGARVVFTLVQDAGADTVLGTVDDTFTFTLLDQVDHTPLDSGAGDDETIVLSLASVFVATDFDGDSIVIDAGATVTIENDVPDQTTATVNINVDEDELATALSTGITDNDATTTVATFSGADIAGLVASGADEPVKVSLNPAIDNVDTGLDSKGENILFDVVSPTQVNGVAGARVVFTLVQDAGADTVLGTVDDTFTFTLLDQVDHTPLDSGAGDDETIVLSLASVFVATDFDGDSIVIDAGATVTIENDVPDQTTATVNINVDEDELATALSTGITDNDATTTVATFSGADIAGLVASGADEPVKVSLNPAIDNVDTGLDSKGENILFDVVSPTQVNGVAGARVVFTLVQDAGADTVLGTVDDTFTFTLLDQVDHTPLDSGAGDDETIVLSLASVFVATDFDGDSIVIDAGATVTIENDVPDQTTATVNINVDEDELATALSTGITDNDATTTVATFSGADIAGLVASGADEPVKVSLNPAIDNVDTGLDSKGENILFDVVSPTQVNGVAGARVVFTLVQDAGADTVLGTVDDTFTFTLLDQVDHTPLDSGAGDDETIVLSLASVFVATDFDGDSIVIDAGATVTIENDVPDQTTATVNINVDEDELATALSTGITDNDATTTVATFSGADIAGLVASGADEPVKVSLNPAIDNVDTGLDSKGENILFDVVSPTQVNGVAGARVVFTLVQDAGADTVLGTVDDTFTFTLLDQVDHTPLDSGAGDDETIVLSLASVFVATDFDGDSIVIDAGATVTIENDVPDQTTATVNINVDEDELATALSTGITDNDATTTVATFSGADIAGLVASGADEPVKVSLNPAIDNVDTGLDSKGENILFDVVSPTQVNGVAGARVVFTLVQDAGADTVLGTVDDTFTFTLLDQVDHTPLDSGAGDDETIVLSLASVFVATDFDGDSIVIDAGATVTIENDVPIATIPEYAVLSNGDGLPVEFNLDLDATLSNNYGADEEGTVRFLASLDETPSGLTSHGTVIIYDVSQDGLTLTGFAGQTSVFVITLDPATATYSVDMNDVVDSITRVDFNSGAYNFVGGNNEWAGFTMPGDNNSSDLLLTPQINHQADGSINTNANEGGVGIGGNVFVNVGGLPETFRIDFVTDLSGDPGSVGPGDYDTLSKRDHVFDGHYLTNGASATFTSTGGSTVNIRAFDDPDTGGDDIVDGPPDQITGVAILFGNNPPLFIDLTQPLAPSYNIAGHIFTVALDGDGKGIDVGGVFGDNNIQTTIAVFTSDGYNAVEYTWVSGEGFKIGNFGASVPSTDPVSFDVPIQVVDFDGDTADSSIGITLATAGELFHDYSNSDLPITAVAGSVANPEPHIIGSDFNDSLTGNSVVNVLSGGKGDDTLIGSDGNDTLIGGLGRDTLNGGAGSDDYVFTNLLDSGSSIATADVISGWTSTDVIDLSGIDAISSVDGNQPFAFVAANTPGTVSNSITWTESGGNTNVSLDTNGIAGAEMMFVLTGIGLNLTEANFNT